MSTKKVSVINYIWIHSRN